MNIEELKHYLLVYERREQLVDRIIKAVEFIENHELDFKTNIRTTDAYSMKERELLKILGGE